MNWLQKHCQAPEGFPEELLDDASLLREENQWRKAVSTPGTLVLHDKEQWIGRVLELRGDPVNGGMVVVEREVEGKPVQQLYSALELSPALRYTGEMS